MITSMTGFGRGNSSAGGIKVECETKSVNSRYTNISIRMPQVFQPEELAIKEIVQQYIQRGKINVYVRVDESERGVPDVTYNPQLISGYAKLLNEIRDTAQITEPLSLQDLLKFDDILQSREEDEETLQLTFKLIKEALITSLENLNQMRAQEGEQLENDIRQRLDDIEKALTSIKKASEGSTREYQEQLTERLEKLLDEDRIDKERLELEIAIIADKIDITEEMVRLESHIKFFNEALERDEPVGRRLNFLLQEMNREVNTIGSKANNSHISQSAVDIKENLEKLREQIQNIE